VHTRGNHDYFIANRHGKDALMFGLILLFFFGFLALLLFWGTSSIG